MKVTKKRLRKIINEEITCAVLNKENQGLYASLDLLLEGHGEEGRMAKAQLLSIMNNSENLLRMLPDQAELEAWVQSKLTKADDYVGSVWKKMSADALLDEEMETPSQSVQQMGVNGTYSTQVLDPHDPESGEEAWFHNIQQASRILEDLPLEELPIQVTDAAQNLRDALDLMISKLDEAKTDKS